MTKSVLLTLALTGVLAGCAVSGHGDSERRRGSGLAGPPTTSVRRPLGPTDQVIVQTPTGPILVPRDRALEMARQHGGGPADIYEPDDFRGQRHSNDAKN